MIRPCRSTLVSAPALSATLILSGAFLLVGAAPSESPMPPRVSVFHIDDLTEQRAAQGTSYLEFLAEPNLRMRLYHLPAGGTDSQSPHGQDEVYYIAAGSGVIDIGGEDHPAGPGSVFFVKAQVPHRFHSITADLDVLVVFSTGPASAEDPDGLNFTPAEQSATRNARENVWNPFLDVATMTFGMYMLPQTVGGDGVLTHEMDEINIVTKGSSEFTVEGESMEIRPGSVVYVDRGDGHRFHSLRGDLDVLILWGR